MQLLGHLQLHVWLILNVYQTRAGLERDQHFSKGGSQEACFDFPNFLQLFWIRSSQPGVILSHR